MPIFEKIKTATESMLQHFTSATMLEPYTELRFSDIEVCTQEFADYIEAHAGEIEDTLLIYESYEVVRDEMERTLDVLRNLSENSEYFQLRVNSVTSFLPRNQPLYALTCFVLIPSLMAREVQFRIPHGMKHFFPQLLKTLRVQEFFSNVVVSEKPRLEFLKERSALAINPHTKFSVPVTDVALFTGTSVHADQLRTVFDKRTLFITNGAGHNPVVITQTADIESAVAAVLALQLYNQGQDCASPNAILVHKKMYMKVLHALRKGLDGVHVGEYRNKENRVGPISDPADLVRIQDLLMRNQNWLDETTPGVVRSREAIVEPTIVSKPLREGGNFNEVFSPIVFLQMYEKDSELALYFENEHYARNAMYVSVYGKSKYIESLIDRQFEGRILHDRQSILHNKHLHEKGMERGTQPYGGLGYGASSISINGKITPKATLPQRDIYEQVMLPLLQNGMQDAYRKKVGACTQIEEKNVEKILRLHSHTQENEQLLSTSTVYIDVRALSSGRGGVYLEVNDEYAYALLSQPNVEYIATLTASDLQTVRELHTLLCQPRTPEFAANFETTLYAIANGSRSKRDPARQLQFFQHVYELLFGKKSGPRLAQFLLDADVIKVSTLLDV